MEIQKEYFVDRSKAGTGAKRVKVSAAVSFISASDLNQGADPVPRMKQRQMGDEYVSVEHLFLVHAAVSQSGA